MTTHNPAAKVREWIDEGKLSETAPDHTLEIVMSLAGYHDVSWRHEALTALRTIRYEAETGDPF